MVVWAADICRVLGVRDASAIVEKLDDDEKGPGSIRTPRGEQTTWLVSESGLYTIILRSRAATMPGSPAHRFRKWVTAEVLPAIRRTGAHEAVIELDDDEKGPGKIRTPGGVQESWLVTEPVDLINHCTDSAGPRRARR